MFGKTQFFSFLILVSLLALAACAPASSSPISITGTPATQESAATDAHEPQMTNPPAQEADTPSPTIKLATVKTLVEGTAAAACFAPVEINPFAFTPDSKSILVRGMAGVQIFDLHIMKETSFLQAPLNIQAAALSPDGQTLAWSLADNSIQLVRVSDQQVLHTLSGHTDMVTKLRFTPGGDELVSASHDGWVRIWNMQGEELRSFQPPGAVLGIGISPDGSTLATVPFDGPVTLWDLESLEKIGELGGSGGYDTSDAEFSPDGQLVTADLATGLYLWRIADSEPVWNEIKNSMAVAFSPDGRYLAYAGTGDNSKVILDTADGSQELHSMPGHQATVWEMFFSPDSKLLLSNDGMEIRIWHAEDGTLQYIGKSACP
jgi:WD40 repeat protein